MDFDAAIKELDDAMQAVKDGRITPSQLADKVREVLHRYTEFAKVAFGQVENQE